MNTRLRSVLLTASLVTAAFGTMTYTACKEEPCKAIICANGSVCNEGACICLSGYEGAQCETVNRDRFINIWRVQEDGTISAPADYALTIKKGSLITEILLDNFGNVYTDAVKARVKGDTMYIDPQPVNNSTIEGKGYLTRDIYYGYNGGMVVRYRITTNGLPNDFGFDMTNADSKPSLWHK